VNISKECDIMLDQHPSLITTADIPEKRESPLTLHPKLFSANHVPDIVGTSGNIPATGLMMKRDIVAAIIIYSTLFISILLVLISSINFFLITFFLFTCSCNILLSRAWIISSRIYFSSALMW